MQSHTHRRARHERLSGRSATILGESGSKRFAEGAGKTESIAKERSAQADAFLREEPVSTPMGFGKVTSIDKRRGVVNVRIGHKVRSFPPDKLTKR